MVEVTEEVVLMEPYFWGAADCQQAHFKSRDS